MKPFLTFLIMCVFVKAPAFGDDYEVWYKSDDYDFKRVYDE